MKNSPIPRGFLLSSPSHFLALGFGTGLSRVAPGTVGTIMGLPVYLLIEPLPLLVQAAILLLLFGLGCYVCDVAGERLGVADHGGIVWDEIVAYAMVLMTVPYDWRWWVAAFAAFRVYDILKPPPIGWLDARFKNGFGVMIDDTLAAVYSIVTLALLQWLL